MRGEPGWFRSPSVLAALVGFVLCVTLELVVGRLGSPAEFSLFLGRFHPMVVHLPIGVLVLVGIAEAATFSPRYRARIEPALGLALPVLLAVTVVAFALGQLLARSGGFPANALSLHRRLEFFAVLGVCVSVALFAYQEAKATPAARNAYRGSLFLTLSLLSVGAHFGGTVTHGDSYLTEHAPGPIARLLGEKDDDSAAASSAKAPKPKPPAEPLVFADVVVPVVEKYCVECHGAKKSKGKLRLDSLEAMLKGGEEGPAFVPGSPATSELVRRIRLPVDDDDRMPPDGKPGPSPEERAVLEFWIERGASATLRVRDTLAPASGRKLLEATLAGTPAVPGAVSPQAAAEAPSASTSAESPEPTKPSADEPTGGAPEKKTSEGDDAAPAPVAASESTAPAVPAAIPAAPSGRAVLAEKCEKCHGASKKKGGLRVDSLQALTTGGESGPGVVPGEPEQSEIIRRVRLPVTQKGHMPPKKEPQLSSAEIASLTAWVRGLSRESATASTAKSPSVAKDTGESRKDEHGAAAADSPGASSEASTTTGDARETNAAETSDAKKTTDAAAAPAEPAESASPDAALLERVPPRIVLYEQAVAPLFAKRCAKCHSGQKPAARLRVDDYAALVEGGMSGPGIVPGKPDESFVCQRIGLPLSHDDRMPPEGEPPISSDEVALVRFWVERGAARELELPAKEFPATALRAAAEYVGPRAEPAAALHADAGCAACSVGNRSALPRNALGVLGLAIGALLLRRRTRRSGVKPAQPARGREAPPTRPVTSRLLKPNDSVAFAERCAPKPKASLQGGRLNQTQGFATRRRPLERFSTAC